MNNPLQRVYAGDEVFVYWNSTRKVFSIRRKNRVVASVSEVILENCTFVVSEKGRQRVLATGRKNVHAGIRGTLRGKKYRPFKRGQWSSPIAAKYNPRENQQFVNLVNNQPLTQACVVWAYVATDNGTRRPAVMAFNRE